MYIGLELLEMYIGLWGVARDVHSSSGGELMKKYIAPLCVKGKGQSDTQYKTISIHAQYLQVAIHCVKLQILVHGFSLEALS